MLQIVRSLCALFIAPPYCVSCHVFLAEVAPLCGVCRSKLRPLISLPLPLTGTKELQVYAFTAYEGIVQSLVRAKNYGQRLPSIQLGQLLASSDCCPWDHFELLVPVPLHWRRYAVRGFNQAVLIAQEIARQRGLQVVPALRRIRYTKAQAGLLKGERLNNVACCFEIDPRYASLLEGKKILLVDDVMTTGATLREMGRALQGKGPVLVAAVVVGRTL